MSRDPEDDDHTTFIQMGFRNDDDEEPVLSRAAIQLHSFGIVNSVEDGLPGFVSDEYLNAISAETSITAAELCACGIWRRVDGGYEVLDQETVKTVVNFSRKMANDREFCRATGGHEPHEKDPNLCRKCGAWWPTAKDWPDDS
jgi:hypothetical protein